MNLSGESVRACAAYHALETSRILVIHDDLDLPLGRIRIRHGGGSGGHKGIESIIDWLESDSFLRLRVGIGRPIASGDSTEISEGDIIAYVLGEFAPDERQTVEKVMSRVTKAILCLLTEGTIVAVNRYN